MRKCEGDGLGIFSVSMHSVVQVARPRNCTKLFRRRDGIGVPGCDLQSLRGRRIQGSQWRSAIQLNLPFAVQIPVEGFTVAATSTTVAPRVEVTTGSCRYIAD